MSEKNVDVPIRVVNRVFAYALLSSAGRLLVFVGMLLSLLWLATGKGLNGFAAGMFGVGLVMFFTFKNLLLDYGQKITRQYGVDVDG